MTDPNDRAVIGGNQPPEPTAIDAARELLADLELEAGNWLDGSAPTSQAQADEVSRLIDAARKASAAFDRQRKAEKQPHLDAGKAVDEAWKPVITDADRIALVAKGALTPYLVAQDRIKREREAEQRRIADQAAAEARRLAAEADGSLAAAQARDVAIETARATEVAAALAERQKAGAKGQGMARTVSLRTAWRAEVTDRRALLNHVAKTAAADLDAFLAEWAERAVRLGARELPGVHAWAEQVAA